MSASSTLSTCEPSSESHVVVTELVGTTEAVAKDGEAVDVGMRSSRGVTQEVTTDLVVGRDRIGDRTPEGGIDLVPAVVPAVFPFGIDVPDDVNVGDDGRELDDNLFGRELEGWLDARLESEK